MILRKLTKIEAKLDILFYVLYRDHTVRLWQIRVYTFLQNFANKLPKLNHFAWKYSNLIGISIKECTRLVHDFEMSVHAF